MSFCISFLLLLEKKLLRVAFFFFCGGAGGGLLFCVCVCFRFCEMTRDSSFLGRFVFWVIAEQNSKLWFYMCVCVCVFFVCTVLGNKCRLTLLAAT